MANAILLNQTNFTKDNILAVLKKSVVSDVTFKNNILTITYVKDGAGKEEISLPLDTKINAITGIGISEKIPQLTSDGQLSATHISTTQIVTVSNSSDLNYEPIN